MKITLFRNAPLAATKSEATEAPAAVKNTITKVSVIPQRIAEIAKKNVLPNGLPSNGKGTLPGGLGQSIPGLGKSGLPGGIDKNGLPGLPGINIPGVDKSRIGGLGKEGLPGLPGGNGSGIQGILGALGKSGLPGMGKGIFGNGSGLGKGLGFGEGLPGGLGIGSNKGPALKMPGSDRMEGGLAAFVKGRWDYGPGGFQASGSAGLTYDGYGLGVNDKGQPGVAKGDHEGGSVTSVQDAQGAANKTINGGDNKSSGSGAPEGMDWSKGTTIKDNSAKKSAPTNTEGPNDLGPSTNDPSTEEKKENETAVAQNDTTKKDQAGKPNPNAMPNPEDSGGGTPRSNVANASAVFTPNPEDAGGGTPRSNVANASAVFTPNPEDAGGGTPRSNTSAIGRLFMPNPEDSGGGTPRSVIANVAAKLRA